jgi:hypothetical protein
VTAAEWIAARGPGVPPALAARCVEALGAHAGAVGDGIAAALLAAGERLLAEIVARPAQARDAALDLLAADALVTWAFEAAADDPASLGSHADAAMARIGRLAEGWA